MASVNMPCFKKIVKRHRVVSRVVLIPFHTTPPDLQVDRDTADQAVDAARNEASIAATIMIKLGKDIVSTYQEDEQAILKRVKNVIPQAKHRVHKLYALLISAVSAFLEECAMGEMTDALWAFFEQVVAPQIMSFQLNDPDQTSPAQDIISVTTFVPLLLKAISGEKKSEVLTFLNKGLRSSDSKECVFIAFPELEKKLKLKSFSLPSDTPQKLTLSHPGDVTLGTLKEFLRSGSLLTHIPTGRKARQKNSKDAIYRRAMSIPKSLFKVHDWEVITSACKQQKAGEPAAVVGEGSACKQQKAGEPAAVVGEGSGLSHSESLSLDADSSIIPVVPPTVLRKRKLDNTGITAKVKEHRTREKRLKKGWLESEPSFTGDSMDPESEDSSILDTVTPPKELGHKDELQLQSDPMAITAKTKQNTRDSPEKSEITSPKKHKEHRAYPGSPSRPRTKKKKMPSSTPVKSPILKSTHPASSPSGKGATIKKRLLISSSPAKVNQISAPPKKRLRRLLTAAKSPVKKRTEISPKGMKFVGRKKSMKSSKGASPLKVPNSSISEDAPSVNCAATGHTGLSIDSQQLFQVNRENKEITLKDKSTAKGIKGEQIDEEVCPGCHKRFEVGQEKHWIGCDYCVRWWHYHCAGFKRRPAAKLKWACKACESSRKLQPQ